LQAVENDRAVTFYVFDKPHRHNLHAAPSPSSNGKDKTIFGCRLVQRSLISRIRTLAAGGQ
jgi:hypothetical protein